MASIFALITSVILVSCPPVEEPKNAEIANVELISTGGKIFSLGNNSLLNVRAIAEVENEKDDTEIVFEWHLFRDNDVNITSVISPSYNSVRVDIDRLNMLGDYTLKCFTYLKGDEKNIKESEFVFTVNTDEILKNSLNYSFSNGENIDLTLSESGATLNKINKEWAYDRKVITSKTDRPIVSGTIPFEVGNDDVLILSFKDNDTINKFGELVIDTDEVNTSYIYTNGYLLYFPNQLEEEQTEKEVNLKIKAGSKQEITIPIKITKASTESINLPNISVFTPYGKSGGRITITGDKVSTTYRPIEDGYKLSTTIYRTYRIVKDNNDLLSDMITISQTKVLSEDDYKTDEDMCYYIEKENAIEYYFPYAGTYYVECFLITPLGNTEKVHYSFVIEPQTLDSSIYTKTDLTVSYASLLNNSKYRNQTANKYIDKNDIQNRVRITPSVKDDRRLFYVLTYEPTAPLYYGEEALMFNEEEVKTSINYLYKMAGNYTVYFHTYDNGNGIGNIPHDSEELDYYLDKNNYGTRNSFIIENLNENSIDLSSFIRPTQATINNDNTTTYTLTVEDELFKTFSTVYIQTFYNGVYKTSVSLSLSSKSFSVNLPTTATSVRISLVYQNNDKATMTNTAINQDISLAKIGIVNLADNLQDRYNYRKLYLNTDKLASTDKVYYRFNGSSTYVSYTKGQYIYGDRNQTPITIKVVSQNGDELIVQQNYTMTTIPYYPVCVSYSDSSQDTINKRKFYYYFPSATSETSLNVYSTSYNSSEIEQLQTGRIYTNSTHKNFYAKKSTSYFTLYVQKYGYANTQFTCSVNVANAINPQISRVDTGACGYFRNYYLHNRAGQDQWVYTTIYAHHGEKADDLIDGHLWWDKNNNHCLENPAYKQYTSTWNLLPKKYNSRISWYNNGNMSNYYSWFTLRYNWEAFYGYGYAGRYATIKVHMRVEQKGYLTAYYTTYLKDNSNNQDDEFKRDYYYNTIGRYFVNANGYLHSNGYYNFIPGNVTITKSN